MGSGKIVDPFESGSGKIVDPLSVPQTNRELDAPEWAGKYPNIYGLLGAAKAVLGASTEMAGMAAGGIVGTAAGGPGVGTAAGVAGGYALVKSAERLAEGERLTGKGLAGDLTMGTIFEGLPPAVMRGVGKVIAPYAKKFTTVVTDKLTKETAAYLKAVEETGYTPTAAEIHGGGSKVMAMAEGLLGYIPGSASLIHKARIGNLDKLVQLREKLIGNGAADDVIEKVGYRVKQEAETILKNTLGKRANITKEQLDSLTNSILTDVNAQTSRSVRVNSLAQATQDFFDTSGTNLKPSEIGKATQDVMAQVKTNRYAEAGQLLKNANKELGKHELDTPITQGIADKLLSEEMKSSFPNPGILKSVRAYSSKELPPEIKAQVDLWTSNPAMASKNKDVIDALLSEYGTAEKKTWSGLDLDVSKLLENSRKANELQGSAYAGSRGSLTREGRVYTELARGLKEDMGNFAKDIPPRTMSGGTKIVNESGEPLVVYHGTDKPEFDVFKPGWREPAIFLTPVEENAWKYAKGVGTPSLAARVEKMTTDIRNPLIVEGRTGTNRLYPLTEAKMNELREQGYDGIVSLGPSGKIEHAREIIPFSPEQIKRISSSPLPELGAVTKGTGSAYENFVEGKRLWRETEQLYDRDTLKIMRLAPEDVVKTINPGEVKNVIRLKEILGEKDFQPFENALIRNIIAFDKDGIINLPKTKMNINKYGETVNSVLSPQKKALLDGLIDDATKIEQSYARTKVLSDSLVYDSNGTIRFDATKKKLLTNKELLSQHYTPEEIAGINTTVSRMQNINLKAVARNKQEAVEFLGSIVNTDNTGVVKAIVKPHNTINVKFMQRILGPERTKEVQEEFLKEYVLKLNEYGYYSPKKAAGVFNQYQKTMKSLMSPEEYHEISNLMELNKRAATLEKMALNPSQTGQTLIGYEIGKKILNSTTALLLGAVGAGATGFPAAAEGMAAAAAVIATPYALAKIYLSKQGRQWLTLGYTIPAGTQESAKLLMKLSGIAGTNLTQQRRD